MKFHQTVSYAAIVTGLAGGLVAPAAVHAQASESAEQGADDNIIIVSARRRDERLVDVPIAARPATPAPTTRTLAGGTLPAAVIWPVKKRPKLLPASITAR